MVGLPRADLRLFKCVIAEERRGRMGVGGVVEVEEVEGLVGAVGPCSR